jgi:hypothetical protein
MTDRAAKGLMGGIGHLLLIFGGLLLGFVVMEELIPYYWYSRGCCSIVFISQQSGIYQFGESIEHDPTLGWVNKRGYSETAKPPDTIFGRVEYSHNSKGLRDEEYPYEKPDGAYRILVLGDSFTYGLHVKQSETFADRLETALKEQGSFEVINAGVIGYNLTQEVLFYEVEGYKYQPDLVMLIFFRNDLPVPLPPDAPPEPGFNLLDGQLVLHNVPYPPLSNSEDTSATGEEQSTSSEEQTTFGERLRRFLRFRWIRRLIESASTRRTPQCLESFTPPDYWEGSWEIVEVVLKRLKEDVEKQGGELVVVSIPASRAYLGCSSSPYSERRNSLCTRQGIAHIDLIPGFSQSTARPCFQQDGHWNTEGHRLAAEIIYAELLKASFEPKPAFEPVQAVFGDQLTLLGCAYGGSSSNFVDHKVPSGEKAWVALRWQGKDLQEDYRVSLRLVDENGHTLGQVDRILVDDQNRSTSAWAEGVMVTEYCLLPVWPTTPPGEYHLGLAVYSSATLEPLKVTEGGSGLTVELGTLQVGRAMRNPAIETLEIESLLLADMREIQLLGYALSTQEAPRPGEEVALPLYWQAKRDVKGDYGLLLHLRDETDEFVLGEVSRLTGDAYPTTGWRKGEIVRGWYDFALPADILPGEYRLVAEMIDMATGKPLKETELGGLRIQDRPRRFEVPSIQHPLESNLGDKVEFLGYGLSAGPLTAGETLSLTLYWRALDRMETSYKVFTHLLGEDNHIWGQEDDIPGQGALPTTGWVKGEVVLDEYEIVINEGAPGGKYRLKIGMYDPLTGERLPVVGEGGKVEGDGVFLGEIQIGP